MARLTWQSVAAPDFNTALQGREMAAKLLGQAANGASTALGNFQTDQAQLADKAVAIEMAKYTDPAAYEAARAAGLITTAAGVRPDQLSSTGLASLGARTSTLQNQVKANFDFTQSMAAAERKETERVSEEAALPLFKEAFQVKDPAQKDALISKAITSNPNLSIDSVQRLTSLAKSSISDRRADADYEFQLGDKVYNQTKVRTSDEDRKIGRQMALDIVRTPGMTEEQAGKDLVRKYPNATPGQISEAIYGLKENGYNNPLRPTNLNAEISPADYIAAVAMDGPVEPEGSTVGYNAFLGSSASNPNGKYAPPPPKPIQNMTLGEAEEYGKTLIAGTKGKGYKELGPEANRYGSSALGAYQIVNTTRERYAKLLYGDDWRNVPYNANTQDELAEAIYNDAKDGNINAVFQGIKNTTPGAYKNVPWEVAKKEISLKESGRDITTPRQDGQFAVSANLSKAARIMQLDATGIVGEYASYIGDKTPITDVTAKLLAGRLKGADKSFVVNRLNEIKDETGGSYAQAGVILADSIDGGSEAFVFGDAINAFRSTVNRLGGDVFVNPKKLRANIDMAKNLKVEDMQLLKSEVEGAQQRLQQAMTNKDAVIRQRDNVKLRGGDTTPYDRRVTVSQRLLEAAQADAAQVNLQPNRPQSTPTPERNIAADLIAKSATAKILSRLR